MCLGWGAKLRLIEIGLSYWDLLLDMCLRDASPVSTQLYTWEKSRGTVKGRASKGEQPLTFQSFLRCKS